jgi:hypothetical protein
MQKSCCEVTVACFGHNDACASLNACLNACPQPKFFVSVGGEPADRDDGSGKSAEPSDPCQEQCERASPSEVTTRTAYDACLRANCPAECLTE